MFKCVVNSWILLLFVAHLGFPLIYGCKTGWFGPGCKNADLATSKDVVNGDVGRAIITDGNEKTCLDSNYHKVDITWLIPHRFSWMRIHVTHSDSLDNFLVIFKKKGSVMHVQCANLTEIIASKTAKDVFCDTIGEITQVVFTGSGVNKLCSVNVSADPPIPCKKTKKRESAPLGVQSRDDGSL